MASTPRPDPASRAVSPLRAWLCLALIAGVVVVAAGLWQAMTGGRSDPAADQPGSLAEIIERDGLQAQIDYLDADANWRELAGVRADVESDDERPWWASLTVAQLVLWLFIAIAIAILASLAYLAVRHGVGLRVDTREAAPEGAREGTASRGDEEIRVTPLSLEEIAALSDVIKALGALQRCVLTTAAEATGSVLRRSETARDALRRLPREWSHYDRVARLVRTAEQVRYAGHDIDREGFDALLADARLILAGPDKRS